MSFAEKTKDKKCPCIKKVSFGSTFLKFKFSFYFKNYLYSSMLVSHSHARCQFPQKAEQNYFD